MKRRPATKIKNLTDSLIGKRFLLKTNTLFNLKFCILEKVVDTENMRILIATDSKETIAQSEAFFEGDIDSVIAGNRLSAQERIFSEHFDLCYYDLNFFKMPGATQLHYVSN